MLLCGILQKDGVEGHHWKKVHILWEVTWHKVIVSTQENGVGLYFQGYISGLIMGGASSACIDNILLLANALIPFPSRAPTLPILYPQHCITWKSL